MEQVSETKEKVEAYLKARFPQRKDLSVAELDRITGGVSHILFSCTITWQEGQDTASETMVFRILPDIGACPPYDIRPQYEAMTRVRGTGIPVPEVYWLEMDSRILDNPFFVMEKVEGESLLGIYNRYPELKDRLNQEFIDCLVKIHQLDWSALGLSVLGVPENNRQYAESEIERWQELIEQSQYRPQPVLTEALVWLKRNVPPAERTTLCHGDYYAHNFLCRDSHIVALLDWEMVSIGDPLSDLGWCIAFLNTVGGFWNEADFVTAYEAAIGKKIEEEVLLFWKVYGLIKFAAGSLATYRTGLEPSTNKEFEVQHLGMFSRFIPVILDQTARTLNF